LGCRRNIQLFVQDNLLHNGVDLIIRGRTDLQNMNTGLNTLDYLLYIGTGQDKMDIALVFVNIIAKDLLALFIDHVQVVDNDHFL
jgi:hypothetical protein